MRPLISYSEQSNDVKKYKVTVYDPLNFYSTRLAFVISPGAITPSTLLTLSNDYAIDDTIYFTAI